MGEGITDLLLLNGCSSRSISGCRLWLLVHHCHRLIHWLDLLDLLLDLLLMLMLLLLSQHLLLFTLHINITNTSPQWTHLCYHHVTSMHTALLIILLIIILLIIIIIICLSLKSLWVCSDQTASGRMASHLSPGQAVKRYVGTSTLTYPLADSYINAAAREPGAAAELAASRKEEKYAHLDGRYTFEPIAIETLGVFNTSARQLLCHLGRKISENTGEVRETSFLFQRCSVLVQRFNSILLHDSLNTYIQKSFLYTVAQINSIAEAANAKHVNHMCVCGKATDAHYRLHGVSDHRSTSLIIIITICIMLSFNFLWLCTGQQTCQNSFTATKQQVESYICLIIIIYISI